jgi:hypothetical protein
MGFVLLICETLKKFPCVWNTFIYGLHTIQNYVNPNSQGDNNFRLQLVD